jgi:ketosteroid isomerase-like protein
MSQEKLEMVQRLYSDCWAPANLGLVPELLHPEVVWTAIESAPDSGTRRGHAGSRTYMNDWLDGFDFQAMPSDEVATTADGRLVCSLHAVGTEKQTGLTTEIRYAGVFRFAVDGRIIEIHEYATVEEALEAVGLSEWPRLTRASQRDPKPKGRSGRQWTSKERR